MAHAVRLSTVLAAILCVFGSRGADAGVAYRYIDLGAAPLAEDVLLNDTGRVAWQVASGDGLSVAIWEAGTMSTLPRPEGITIATLGAMSDAGVTGAWIGAGFSGAYRMFAGVAEELKHLTETTLPLWPVTRGMNNDGLVVGSALDSVAPEIGQLISRPAAWRDSGPFALETEPDGLSGEARAINEAGLIVGTTDVPGRGPLLTLWSDDGGLLRTVEHPDGLQPIVPTGINDAGLVVGYVASPPFRALTWDGSTWGELARDDTAIASAVNNDGTIVGQSPLGRAVAWDGSGMHDLLSLVVDAPGVTLTRATDINDSGWIAGVARDATGSKRAYLLVPVPQPGTTALSVLAVAVAATRRLRG